jgi:hypothetical protein
MRHTLLVVLGTLLYHGGTNENIVMVQFVGKRLCKLAFDVGGKLTLRNVVMAF